MQHKSSIKIGYALGGGGAPGLSHIGVLKVLEEYGIFPSTIAGTSIGAIIGALYASGLKARDIEKIALGLNWKRILSLADLSLPSNGLVRGRRVVSMLKEILGDMTFSQLQYDYACVTTDIITGEEIVFRQGSLLNPVRASFSIPGVFKPVYLNGRYLVDGGLTNVVPVNTCKAMGADYVIAVNVIPNPTNVMCQPKNGAQFEICDLTDSMLTSQDAGTNVLPRNQITRVRKPTLWEVLSQALTISQYQVAKENMRTADLPIWPRVEHIDYWEFHRTADIINAGEEAASDILSKPNNLSSLLGQ